MCVVLYIHVYMYIYIHNTLFNFFLLTTATTQTTKDMARTRKIPSRCMHRFDQVGLA